MTQSPRNRKCKPALLRGLCGMPLALSFSEGLGITGRDARGVVSLAYPHGSLYLQPFVLEGLILGECDAR